MACRHLPSQAYLREALDYNPKTGLLRWRHRRPLSHFESRHGWLIFHAKFAGLPITGLNHEGYIRVSLAGRRWVAQRIIWKWMTGEDPVEVDHINLDRADNRWQNLRDAPEARIRNRSCRVDNASGFKGVRYRKGRLFQARIRVGNIDHYLGAFATAEGAHAAYCDAAKKYFGEYWSPG